MTEWVTRFRRSRAELKRNGVDVRDIEAGYKLRAVSLLSPARVELLDVATGGSFEYAKVEEHLLRLFRQLHLQERRGGVLLHGRLVCSCP